MRNSTPATRRLATLLTLLSGFAAPAVLAQPGSSPSRPITVPPRTAPAKGVAADPLIVPLAKEPFHLEAVGLTMNLPAETSVQSSRAGGRTTAQIVADDEKARTWMITIQTPQTTNPNATIVESAEQTIALLQGSVGVVDPSQTKVLKTDAKVLERTDSLTLGGGECARFYVSLPPPPGESGRIVRGYTIFKPAPTQFVVFELITPESELPRSKRIYETTVATAQFADPQKLAEARGAAVKSGQALLSRITAKDYEACLDGQERWYRLYRPAIGGNPADAEELGYRGVTFWRGKRGEVDTSRPRSQWNRADSQDGYLVRFRIRLVQSPNMVDTMATYFMTPDRVEEAWLVQSSIRDPKGKVLASWQEIGARDKDDMTVSIAETRQSPKVNRPFIQQEGYLCQVESYLLPQLLIRAGVATEFGFYTYRSATETVSLRRDTLSREQANAGAWTLKTEYRDDSAPQVSVFTDKGELVRSDIGDGRLWKPVDPHELLELWKRKGLPVGAMK